MVYLAAGFHKFPSHATHKQAAGVSTDKEAQLDPNKNENTRRYAPLFQRLFV